MNVFTRLAKLIIFEIFLLLSLPVSKVTLSFGKVRPPLKFGTNIRLI